MSQPLLRFVHISDTHLRQKRAWRSEDRPQAGPPPPSAFLDTVNKIVSATRDLPDPELSARQAVTAINALPLTVDFVLHTGDVGFDFDSADAYREVQSIFAACRFPVYVLAGNHDRPELLHPVFSRALALTPTFDYEIPGYNAQIICLDTSKDVVSDAQLGWLEAQIEHPDPRPLIAAMHHNVIDFDSFFPDFCALQNARAVRDILTRAGTRLRGVFYGHLHVALDTVEAGISYFCAPSTYQQFDINVATDATRGADTASAPGFNVVTLTANATYVRKMTYRVSESVGPTPHV